MLADPRGGRAGAASRCRNECCTRVARAELFATDATRKAITFPRAPGDRDHVDGGPLRIKQRAGHATFSTTEGYIREAENLGASFWAVFPALPADLAFRTFSARDDTPNAEASGTIIVSVGATGFEVAYRVFGIAQRVRELGR